MNKLQIQLPTPLYKKLKLLAKRLDYSMAELIRRGAEQIVVLYPQYNENIPEENTWQLPVAKNMGLKKINSSNFRKLAYEKD